MTDEQAAWKVIYERLNSYTSLMALLPTGVGVAKAIYEHPGPQGSSRPMVTITKLSARQIMAHQEHIAATEFRFLVRAIGSDTSKKQVLDIATEIDGALHKYSSTESGWSVDCYRTEPFSMPETDNSRQWHHAGSVFTTWVRRT
jgi:hypothetical protein